MATMGCPAVRARVIRVYGAGHCLVQSRHLLDAPVCLAGQVDHGDDGPLDIRVDVGVDDFADCLRQGQRFGQTDLARRGPGRTGLSASGTTAR